MILCPFSTESLKEAKYFVIFIDDKSHIYVKPLKKQSDVLDGFKEYKAHVEKQTDHKIKKLRTIAQSIVHKSSATS